MPHPQIRIDRGQGLAGGVDRVAFRQPARRRKVRLGLGKPGGNVGGVVAGLPGLPHRFGRRFVLAVEVAQLPLKRPGGPGGVKQPFGRAVNGLDQRPIAGRRKVRLGLAQLRSNIGRGESGVRRGLRVVDRFGVLGIHRRKLGGERRRGLGNGREGRDGVRKERGSAYHRRKRAGQFLGRSEGFTGQAGGGVRRVGRKPQFPERRAEVAGAPVTLPDVEPLPGLGADKTILIDVVPGHAVSDSRARRGHDRVELGNGLGQRRHFAGRVDNLRRRGADAEGPGPVDRYPGRRKWSRLLRTDQPAAPAEQGAADQPAQDRANNRNE